jgi:hypothetical protein
MLNNMMAYYNQNNTHAQTNFSGQTVSNFELLNMASGEINARSDGGKLTVQQARELQ